MRLPIPPPAAVTGPAFRGGIRVAIAAVAAVAVAALASGCGSKFELPTERPAGRAIPSDKSYQMLATWSGFQGVQDLLLTQGVGRQLFVLFNNGGAGTAPRGRVRQYVLSRPEEYAGVDFRTLFNPVALCAGGDGAGSAANRIYVLDQGDTCIARTNSVTGRCDSTRAWNTRITDLEHYWRVREFGLLGGDTVSTFTDTTMAFVYGVAADAEGRVYVSGISIQSLPNPFDPRLRERAFQFRVYRYERGPRYPGVVPFDRNMPGALWHRDTTWAVEEGSGLGTIFNPRGLTWSAAGGRALYVADFGKNWVQKLYDDLPSTGFYPLDGSDSGRPFTGPTDVATDLAGFVYIADTGNLRALRYSPDGSYVQVVNVEPNKGGQPLRSAVSVAADEDVVYVADRDAGEVIRYRRRP